MTGAPSASFAGALLRRLALLGLGVLLACSLLELLARLAPGLFRSGAIRSQARLSADRGEEAKRIQAVYGRRSPYQRLDQEQISRIGVSGIQYRVYGFDLTSSVRYNSLGIRDRDPDQVQGRATVLMLGDSFVEGKGVTAAATIPALLEAELGRRGQDWAVVNAGIEGAGTADQLHMLKFLGPRYHPRRVVLVVYLANDIRNNSLLLDTCLARARSAFRGRSAPSSLRAPRGFYWRLRTGEPYRYVAAGTALGGLLGPSEQTFLATCGQLATRCVAEQGVGRRALETLGAHLEFPKVLSRLLFYDVEIVCEPRIDGAPISLLDEVDNPAPQLQEAWEVTAFLLGSARDETRKLGADLYVVSLPSRIEIDVETRMRTFRAYGLETKGFRQWGPESRLGSVLSDLGIPYLDLVSETRERSDAPTFYFPIDGHPNSLGNRFFANRIAEWLAVP